MCLVKQQKKLFFLTIFCQTLLKAPPLAHDRNISFQYYVMFGKLIQLVLQTHKRKLFISENFDFVAIGENKTWNKPSIKITEKRLKQQKFVFLVNLLSDAAKSPSISTSLVAKSFLFFCCSSVRVLQCLSSSGRCIVLLVASRRMEPKDCAWDLGA